jgi:hypothetical protein
VRNRTFRHIGDKIVADMRPEQGAMHMLLRLSAAIVVTTAGVVMAQSAPADLVAAYRAGVAAAKCDLALDSAKTSELGDAVQRIEQRSGLSQNELDALWTQTQDLATADSAAYCAKEAGGIDAVITSSK